MKPFVILFFLGLCCSAYSQKHKSATLVMDTIPEKNSRAYLDFERHQLFIDTAANSSYHKRLRQFYNEANLNSWVVVRQLSNGQFVLYDRADGMDPVFQLQKDSLMYNGVHERHAFPLSSITKRGKEIRMKNGSDFGNFEEIKIVPSKHPYISIISFKGDNSVSKYWIADIRHIHRFYCLVSDYKYEKVGEYDGFIEPE